MRRCLRRANVVGWVFVVLVTLLVEAGVRAFDYETSIATPSSTLRALATASSTSQGTWLMVPDERCTRIA